MISFTEQINPIHTTLRLKELLIDYLVIVGYLLAVLGIAVSFYMLIFQGIPKFSELQSQAIASLTSVIPVIVIFSFLDWRGGSLGKRKTGLKVRYKTNSAWRSIVRNMVKFLPWQLAHIGVINGIYSNWDSWWSTALASIAIVLSAAMLAMVFFRKDKRHIGDILAGTQVVAR